MSSRVLVLGAGFGGLEIAASLSEEFGESLDLVLIDQGPGFIFGFSKLDVMMGRVPAERVLHPFDLIAKPGVTFVPASITAIDPAARTVTTTAGEFSGDIVVIALGADLDPAATPGLQAGGHEFYTPDGAFAAGEALAQFGGGSVVVGVTSTPFKCPPAPSETALLVHDLLVSRGLREDSTVGLVMPFPVPIPPSPAASTALLAAFDQRGIEWLPDRLVTSLDPDERIARCSDGSDVPYDLFLGVPVHRVPAVVEESGLAVDGWIPVDPLTLETRFANVYAVGDCTSVGTPKAGVFAEGQGAVVAQRIIDRASGGHEPSVEYDGHGLCYLEFGAGEVAAVDVTFMTGQRPTGDLFGPSVAYADDKVDFGASRIARWFGVEWTPHR